MGNKGMNWLNGLAVLTALGVAIGVASSPQGESSRAPAEAGSESHVVDARGRSVSVKKYRRIASGSTVADRLLLELCEPDRVVAYTGFTSNRTPWAHRHAGKATVDRLADVEALIQLKPDLVVVSHFTDARPLARLREAGLEVFDLGANLGMASFKEDASLLSKLIGEAPRGERFVKSLERRLGAYAQHSFGMTALYLSQYGNEVYCGTRGSPYNDALTLAGLTDAAAESFKGVPAISPEKILDLDPDVLVVADVAGQNPCAFPGLDALRACRNDRVVRVDGALVADPGPYLLELVEALRWELGRLP